MHIVVAVCPEEHTRFAGDAFGRAVGVTVPFEVPGMGSASALLVDAQVADAGRSAKLMFEVPDWVANVLRKSAHLYSLGWSHGGVTATAIPAVDNKKARDHPGS